MITLIQRISLWLLVAGLFSIGLTAVLTGQLSPLSIIYLLATWIALGIWGSSLERGWRFFRRQWYWRYLLCLGYLVIFCAYVLASIWLIHPDILPSQITYDFISNLHVTEKLVDPGLIKVERWDILDKELDVLYLHPANTGSTALVYPVKVEPRTTFNTYLAVAPEAWNDEGDGVIFSLYVEDNAGFHLLYSQYIDPKHQQQDRRWIPVEVSLNSFKGNLVRIILAVNSGPAGDLKFDWAGWGEPHLERPIWP